MAAVGAGLASLGGSRCGCRFRGDRDDLHQDLKNGTKLRLETTVEAKLLVGGISPTIVVRGEKQAISRASYNSLQVGDCVRLEIAPRSRTFLSLQKI
jgi:hypothetical protein